MALSSFRPARRWVLLPLLLAAAFALGRSCGRDGELTGPRSRARSRLPAGDAGAAPAPPRAGAGTSGTAPRPAQRTASPEGTVVGVGDGDSIVVLRGGVGIEVRLFGVDCPELAQPFGRKARGFTSRAVLGKEVRVVAQGKDRYGRELAEVVLPDGRSLNRELVSAGLAWWYRKYSTDKELEERERRARAARLGLWADASPVPPWEFRSGR